MTWLVQPRLINDPFSDPGLFIDFRFGRRALLFDLGDVTALSSRELLRVSHAFVSHTHMDHFAGFDRLLRFCLHRDKPLHLIGPGGFAERVQHKLEAYTWNLLGAHSFDCVLTAAEFVDDRFVRMVEFRARETFRPRELAPPDLPAGVVLDEEEFQVRAVTLDHDTPCLAFALQEKQRINVWNEGLRALGLPVGPWIGEAKRALRRAMPDTTPIDAGQGRTISLGELKQALRIVRGQKIAYVVDASYSEANSRRIVELAAGADLLFIEATFLHEHVALAVERHHLTAAQAGDLAKRAGVARLVPMHFSARYLGHEERVRQEAELAFRGDWLGCTGCT